jgi:hypothetical protein
VPYRIATASYNTRAFILTMLLIFPIGYATVLLVLQTKFMTLPYIGLLWIIVLFIYIRSPRYYMVSEKEISINRLIGNIVIPKSKVKSIKLLDNLSVGLQKKGRVESLVTLEYMI